MRIFWIELQPVDIDVIAGSPGAAPANLRIMTELDHRITERTIAHHIVSRTMKTNRIGIGRLEKTELRAIDQN
ncbi:hypothetical protein D3C81_1400680 [compost metagenome]